MWRIAVGALVLAASVATAVGAETLRYDVRFDDTVLAAKPDELSLGDRFILSDILLQDGAEVGSNSGICTITDIRGAALCNVTFILPGGTLSIQFVNSPPPEKHFAVTGATGDFAGREGSGVLVEHGDGTGSVTFVLE